MFCPKCGKEVKEGARFCDRCGAPLSQDEGQDIQDRKQGSGEKTRRKKKYVPRIFALSAIILLAVVFVVNHPSGDRKLIKKTTYDSKRNVKEWMEYSYDSEGNLTKETYYKGDNLWPTREYNYDSEGNMIRETNYYDESGEIWQSTEYSYDSDGNRIKAEYHGTAHQDEPFGEVTKVEERTISSWIEYSYDSRGNEIEEIQYYDSGDPRDPVYYWYKWEYSYDSNGNIMTMQRLTKWDLRDEWYDEVHEEYSYDKDGNIIKTLSYRGNDPSRGQVAEYSYDKNDNVIEKTDYREDGSISNRYKYRYDSEGNMIKETHYIYGDGSNRKSVTTYKNEYE